MRPPGRLVVAAALVAAVAGCGGERGERPAPESAPAAPAAPQASPEPAAPLPLSQVTLYFPSPQSDRLVPEPREILATAAAGDRVKQIVVELLSGPQNAEAALPALPQGTELRQVFVLDDGTAWVDLSARLVDGMPGGIENELLTAYAVVNSITQNVPEVTRVGLLVDGRPVETLSGHLDLRRPLPPNLSLAETR